MIDYDPHQSLDLCSLHGSVLPTACVQALPMAIMACVLRTLVVHDFFSTDMPETILNSHVFTDFTFLLGMTMIFRTTQGYLRYWRAGECLYQMTGEFTDSCACLVGFAYNSARADAKVVHSFAHTIVRLFCLLHALALEDLSMLEEDMPLIDARGIDTDSLSRLLLSAEEHPGERVRVVLTWIKSAIVKHMDDGTLHLPSPIITRVFEELSHGLEHFHEAQIFERWPLPFPHSQFRLALIHLYMAITPIMVSGMELHPWVCGLTCFLSIMCMLSADLIAAEIEQPFGADANDMPLYDLQAEMNRRLAMLLNPTTHTPPTLASQVNLRYVELARQQQHELEQCWEQSTGELRTTWKDDVSKNTMRKPIAGHLHISDERGRDALCAKQEGREPCRGAPKRVSTLVLPSEPKRQEVELPCPQEFMQELRGILQKQSEQNLQQLHRIAEWEHQHQLLLQESQLNSLEQIFGCGEDNSVAEIASLKRRLQPKATGSFISSRSSSFTKSPAFGLRTESPWKK
mmetsp:Transcript_36166/g.91013  ORF Transcript_36166/g.91013 Transcript_36166/m.91013 type:complete len:516 (-) Transcript_36166:101-1648(-)